MRLCLNTVMEDLGPDTMYQRQPAALASRRRMVFQLAYLRKHSMPHGLLVHRGRSPRLSQGPSPVCPNPLPRTQAHIPAHPPSAPPRLYQTPAR
jgi:hypothetical protein